MLPDHPHFQPLADFALHRAMQIEFVFGADGKSHIAFPVTDAMLTPSGALHAGYVYTASDLAAYVALMSLLTRAEAGVTHDIHVSLMRTAPAGARVDIHADVVRKGRTLAFIDVKATWNDRLLATARVTKSIISA